MLSIAVGTAITLAAITLLILFASLDEGHKADLEKERKMSLNEAYMQATALSPDRMIIQNTTDIVKVLSCEDSYETEAIMESRLNWTKVHIEDLSKSCRLSTYYVH